MNIDNHDVVRYYKALNTEDDELDECVCGECGQPLICEHSIDASHEVAMCGNCAGEEPDDEQYET